MDFSDTLSIYSSVISVINNYLLVAEIGFITAIVSVYVIYFIVKKLISRV